MKLLISVIVIFSSCQFSFAADDALSVKAAWARPVILQNRPGAAYLTIKNDTDRADHLIRVSSALAERVELHVHRHEGGVMRMMRVKEIPVAAHSTLAVEPGGYHLMLLGLKKKLVAGDELPLTLTFEHAGEIKIAARVMKKAPVPE